MGNLAHRAYVKMAGLRDHLYEPTEAERRAGGDTDWSGIAGWAAGTGAGLAGVNNIPWEKLRINGVGRNALRFAGVGALAELGGQVGSYLGKSRQRQQHMEPVDPSRLAVATGISAGMGVLTSPELGSVLGGIVRRT